MQVHVKKTSSFLCIGLLIGQFVYADSQRNSSLPSRCTVRRGLGQVGNDEHTRFGCCNKPVPISPVLCSFEAMTVESAIESGFYPPDPTNGVGFEDIVLGINNDIAVVNKENLTIDFQAGMPDFFASVGTDDLSKFADPWIVYDQYEDRFVVVWFGIIDTVEEQKGFIYLAVSKSGTFSNPPQISDWHMYKFDVTGTSPDGPTFLDYEKLGFDTDAYYISGPEFPIDGGVFVKSVMFAVKKSDVLNGGPTPTPVLEAELPGVFTTLPVISYDQQPQAMYIVSPLADQDAIRIFTITDILGSPNIVFNDVPVAPFFSPLLIKVFPPLPATAPLDTLGDRIMSGVVRNNILWTAHAVIDEAVDPDRVLVRWYAIDVSGPVPQLVEQQTVYTTPAANDNIFIPYINVDACNNMGLAFSIVSETRFPGIAYTGKLATDPEGLVRPVLIARDGDQTYQVGEEESRWGDYSGLALDPSDQRTFWLYNEYALFDPDFNPSQLWGTFGASFTVGCCNQKPVRSNVSRAVVVPQGKSLKDAKPLTAEQKAQYTSSIPKAFDRLVN